MLQAPMRKAMKMMDINLHNLHGGRSDFYDDFYHYGIFTSDGGCDGNNCWTIVYILLDLES